MPRTSDRPTIWELVDTAVRELGGSTTNIAVRDWIQQRYPDTNRSSINCHIIAGTVNHSSRVHYYVDARPRPANDPDLDVFFRPERGRLETYDPQRHGKWEIYASDKKLDVRLVSEWPATTSSRIDEKPADASLSTKTVLAVPDAPVSGEVGWMHQLRPKLEASLQSLSFGNIKLRVDAGYRLPYAYEVLSYRENAPEERRAAKYQTDLLIYDEAADGTWVPRVILECKVKGVTTHDALTYSGKAATHKNVHPYLRYGILVGSYGTNLPARLIRHGAHFDFMAVWEDEHADSLGVFNSQLMNDAVWKFRRYEDASLRYMGVERHRPLEIGLWDTALSEQDFQASFESLAGE